MNNSWTTRICVVYLWANCSLHCIYHQSTMVNSLWSPPDWGTTRSLELSLLHHTLSTRESDLVTQSNPSELTKDHWRESWSHNLQRMAHIHPSHLHFLIMTSKDFWGLHLCPLLPLKQAVGSINSFLFSFHGLKQWHEMVTLLWAVQRLHLCSLGPWLPHVSVTGW